MRTLHVASAQIVAAGGPAQTLPQIDALSKAAALLGAEAVLFSEVVVHGYDYDMCAESVGRQAEPLDGPVVGAIRAMANRNRIAILAGTFERDGAAIYNSHVVAEPSGRLHVQRKHRLTESEQRAGLRAGPRARTVFELNGVRCAVLICADTGIEGLPEELKQMRVDLRFIPTGGGGKLSDTLGQSDLETPEGRRRYEENRPRVCIATAFDPQCQEWGSAFVSSNALGPAGTQTCHQGHCIIVDAQGVLRAQAVGTLVREHMHAQVINAVLSFR